MKKVIGTRLLLISAGLCTLLTAGTASAEYRVTALGKATGFTELLATDASKAASKLGALSLFKMDFLEFNNLCVTEILLENYELAIATCHTALEKTESALDISFKEEKKAKAAILSNLAVAKAKSGDAVGAKLDLELALSLNSRNANAVANYGLISEITSATEIAAQ